ncbi:hydantoinase/oxoprolinase family protein [Sinorhizobium meliloti]|uniref:hydantoinase/oxoprolinase family protein n=1 Tax=Rhizobium meliloti TaxID=382 RepID=UPI000FD3707F|nr:hydantoinase/oxoprolinase family protein [Sinorhizobium meliloti]MQV24956.1 hydantoinase/oxoprolinase family protein [Sinorhizobium meliloti]MQV37374.1 hydantoinase/oxoprolinase family protein [Sinorhizobium meliloti]RVE77425.1 hydantoinase/oxoprolinase family protein [Sinorhizobium meliloti]RVG41298.1 hydantoinase/oxoprolinase family protein [Sinorhizobium meliloti]RVM08206.1 hydantoinase/oxoprolinase family protein [Sinorhizobium meliloti]
MLVAPYRVGVDIGGTFTDMVMVDSRGAVRAFKAPSVPSDPTEGVLSAVRLAADSLGVDVQSFLSKTELFVHGSTIATNTLLEKKGAKVGLLVTEGFRDSLEIRRSIRENVWDHRRPFPEVLVPRYLRLPVTERIEQDGTVRIPFNPDSVAAAARVFAGEGVEAVAICFLHSYANPAHERAAKAELKKHLPDIWVTASSDIAPTIGEYERTSTTVVNAYVSRRVVPYLESLAWRLTALGLPRKLLMIQSNGGAISIDEIGHAPASLVLSGPAAGVGSLKFFGQDTGSDHLISIEVGGTSCDVTLMQQGMVSMTDQIVVDGYHLNIPAVDIHTVGAGGGTIASVDRAGLLAAGPEGAGSTPGPACYGRGGERPTVTDAQLVLGRLKPGPYAGGVITLSLERAVEAIETHVAKPLGLSVTDAAAGIIQLVEQNILHAVERASLEKGYNPRMFTLVAAGGAGPLHGPSTARLLGSSSLYVPRLAGVFCAFGMCNSDLRHDYVRSWLKDLDNQADSGPDRLEGTFEEMQAEANEVLAREGFTGSKAHLKRAYDLRYFGQQWTVAVESSSTNAASIRAAFEEVYQRLFGYVQPSGAIEIVNLRLAAIGKLDALEVAKVPGYVRAPVAHSRRPVWINTEVGFVDTPVYDGTLLSPRQQLIGPAIIEEATTTLIIGVADKLTMTDAGNYHIDIAHGQVA